MRTNTSPVRDTGRSMSENTRSSAVPYSSWTIAFIVFPPRVVKDGSPDPKDLRDVRLVRNAYPQRRSTLLHISEVEDPLQPLLRARGRLELNAAELLHLLDQQGGVDIDTCLVILGARSPVQLQTSPTVVQFLDHQPGIAQSLPLPSHEE